MQRIALDRTGVTGKVLAESTPVAGDNVVSTVDMKLQSTVEQELAAAVAEARFKGFPADSAAAVVLDATNGDVLAAASLPTYDRKLFADGLTDDEYAQITANDQPLLDRTIQAQLAPASTFKPITTTAAAQAGFDFGQSYPCPSTFYWGNQGYTNYESEAFPPLTIADALKVSCNTVFFNLAAQMYQQDGGLNPTGTPKELVSNAAKAFGYRSKTGVDLVGEASGLVMDRAQKKSDYAELSAAYRKRADTGYPRSPTRPRPVSTSSTPPSTAATARSSGQATRSTWPSGRAMCWSRRCSWPGPTRPSATAGRSTPRTWSRLWSDRTARS